MNARKSERDDESELPERERGDGDAADDEGRDRGALSGLLHAAKRSPPTPTLPLYEHVFAR